MAEVIFWTAFAGIAYVYVGYPVLLLAWRMWGGRPIRKTYYEPTVSLVMAMHNEKANVRR